MTRWVDSTAALEVVTPDGTELLRVVKNGVSKAVRTGDIADADAAAAIAAHVAQSDPHTQYLKESGARAELGLATTDSPQFAAINLDHASDTTLTRLGAGRMGVEGAELAFARYYDVNSPAYAGSIQAAIDAAETAGGGTVMVPYSTYALGSTGLTLKPGVMVMGLGWPVITYTGSGEMIGTASTGVLVNAGIAGFVLNHGASATHGINLRSAYNCYVDQIRFRGSNTSIIALRIGVNTSGSTNNAGNRNAAFSKISSVFHDETCGTFVQLEGGSSASEVVTLNEFQNMHCFDARVRGWDFAKWVDNNYCTFSRIKIAGNDSVGAEYNTADPTNNVGVYANNFGFLAVDTFSTYTGRIGIKINNAKQIKAFLYQNPKAEGGAVVVASSAASYLVHEVDDTTGTLIIHTKDYTVSTRDMMEFSRTDGAVMRLTNSTNAASNAALYLRSSRATPAANDDVHIIAQVNDSAGNVTDIASLRFLGSTVTDGAETGQIRLNLAVSGALAERYLWSPLAYAPVTNGLASLGTVTLSWAGLCLASSGAINWNNGGVTITESSDNLVFAGVTTSYQFDKKLHVTVADTAQGALISGASKGVRIVPNSAATLIEGVDNTGAGSYQPLSVGGSQINFTISGTSEIVINGTSMAPQTDGGSSLGVASTNRYGSLHLLPVAVASLPTGAAGSVAFASNGRKNGEGAGAGTGVLCFHDGTAWRACDTGATVAA